MIEKIKEILADNLEVEMDEIGDDSHIQEDLGADSLDVMDIMTAIEDEFDIQMEEDLLCSYFSPNLLNRQLQIQIMQTAIRFYQVCNRNFFNNFTTRNLVIPWIEIR